jgi:hypothetical protein
MIAATVVLYKNAAGADDIDGAGSGTSPAKMPRPDHDAGADKARQRHHSYVQIVIGVRSRQSRRSARTCARAACVCARRARLLPLLDLIKAHACAFAVVVDVRAASS